MGRHDSRSQKWSQAERFARADYCKRNFLTVAEMRIRIRQEAFLLEPKRSRRTFRAPNDAWVHFRREFETVKTSRLHWKWMKTERKKRVRHVDCSRFRLPQLRA